MELSKEQIEILITQALKARKNAYVPYSNYSVGAALLAKNGQIFGGCNVESASFGATNCAERTAVFKAVSEGIRDFKAIAVAGGIVNEMPTEYAYPCGICRQVINEFVGEDFLVIVAKSTDDYKIYPFTELLPYGFGGESIR